MTGLGAGLDCRFTAEHLVGLRHQVEAFAARHGMTGLALYRFVVAVNELTTNAVRHGGGGGRLELVRDGDRLRCRVVDTGAGMAAGRPPRPAAPRAVAGRGLWLVRQIADTLDIDTRPTGTSVTLTAPLR